MLALIMNIIDVSEYKLFTIHDKLASVPRNSKLGLTTGLWGWDKIYFVSYSLHIDRKCVSGCGGLEADTAVMLL